ncbi:DSS1/SEM1 family-domain-containing protein [Plectosphaerella cucumerina]|uniref:26S proteasome complex subunit SEM1 n=1 Tax=Plectosphaerella cucumerina TaxID=40658 RepID=A0A8K0TA02_9PEZI|nr:DSS1/SEM1 family-domain-containing protein [Plectosphaerella cucumerina]
MASSDSKTQEKAPAAEQAKEEESQKPVAAAALGEDDEFEDFPVDDWAEEETEATGGTAATQHLWEESWDDDDTNDDFSAQLKEELKKVEASKRR